MVATANWPRPATALVLQIEAPQIFAFRLSEGFFLNVFYNSFLNIFFQLCWLCRNGCAADYQLTEIGRYCFADWFSGSRPFSAFPPLWRSNLVWNSKCGRNLFSISALEVRSQNPAYMRCACQMRSRWHMDGRAVKILGDATHYPVIDCPAGWSLSLLWQIDLDFCDDIFSYPDKKIYGTAMY